MSEISSLVTETPLKRAMDEWVSILGSDAVELQTELPNCLGMRTPVAAVIYPRSLRQIILCTQVANTFKVPIYPVSTGNNWGYGSSLPVKPCSAVFNLSKMNRILGFDESSGVITLEPGVTQGQLSAYLEERNLSYLVPATGAGPSASIVGNAIERGYGAARYSDHFSAVMTLQAVLPDGSVYESMLSQLGNKKLDRLYKWGIGAYVDGLFSQGNLGIVTQMSIALAPATASTKVFFFSVETRDELPETILRVQKSLKEFSGVIGGINVMNQHRVLAMTAPYPKDQLEDGLIPPAVVESNMRKRQIYPWTCIGSLCGNKRVVRAAQRELKKTLGQKAKRLVFLSPDKVVSLNRVLMNTPIVKNTGLAEYFATLSRSMSVFQGKPSDVALPLAYWVSGKKTGDASMSPSRDGCGLIWYSPLVPMQPDKVESFVSMVEKTCADHRIEPLITLTSLSYRCFDCTIPILFDKEDHDAVRRADQCFNELFDKGRELGFVPYRLGVQSMQNLSKYQAAPALLTKIKESLDPGNIMSPGRYLPDVT